MPRKHILFRGKWYKSMAEAARDHGLQPNTLHKANLAGRIREVGKRKGNPVPVRLNGKDYPSIKEAARCLGVDRATISRTLDRGEDTVKPRGKPVKVGSLEFPSISECARHFKVTRHVVQDLIKRRALYTLLPKQPAKSCMNCGKPVTLGTHLCNECRNKTFGIE